MNESNQIHILLADDDKDDCLFFREALEELPIKADLSIVHDGEELLKLLKTDNKQLPSVIFLDLNMPRINGFECLTEINKDQKLRQLPTVIISTSFKEEKVEWLNKNGPVYYIRKPSDFSKLKSAILKVITLLIENNFTRPQSENFVINHPNQ